MCEAFSDIAINTAMKMYQEYSSKNSEMRIPRNLLKPILETTVAMGTTEEYKQTVTKVTESRSNRKITFLVNSKKILRKFLILCERHYGEHEILIY